MKTLKSQFDVNVANGFAIDVANDVLPVWWMEVYPFRFNQSKSLLHAEIERFYFTPESRRLSYPLNVIYEMQMFISLSVRITSH